MTNDKEYLDINYEKAQNKIEFLYEGETIIGNIFGNKISFDNKSFSKNNYIEISKNDIKIYLSIKDEDYLVYGTTNNSKVKFEEKENKINKERAFIDKPCKLSHCVLKALWKPHSDNIYNRYYFRR